LNLGDKFILNFNVYEDFVENFISKLKTPAEKTSIRRKFNTLKPKMDRKIKLYFKKVAKEMGYFEIKPDVFDRSLGQFKKSWEEILKRKSGRRGQKARKKRKKKKAKYKAPAGVYTQPKLRERIHATLLNQNTHGTAAGEWSARKSQELNRRYQKAGGGFVNKK